MDARRVAPYFVVAALVHLGAVATRFDVLAAMLSPSAHAAVTIAQFPLLVLSGYFEGRIDHGDAPAAFPLWMRIKSWPVKAAFAFGFLYLAVVALQTWGISAGPIDADPPHAWPTRDRALWFFGFTVGMGFSCLIASTSLLVPVLRAITWPLRELPPALGAVLALVLGGAIGLGALAAVTSGRLAEFADTTHAALDSNPLLAVVVLFATLVVPLAIGIVLELRADRAR